MVFKVFETSLIFKCRNHFDLYILYFSYAPRHRVSYTTDSQEIYVCTSVIAWVIPTALRETYLNTVFGTASPVTIQHFNFFFLLEKIGYMHFLNSHRHHFESVWMLDCTYWKYCEYLASCELTLFFIFSALKSWKQSKFWLVSIVNVCNYVEKPL